jgi:hypothetical protein
MENSRAFMNLKGPTSALHLPLGRQAPPDIHLYKEPTAAELAVEQEVAEFRSAFFEDSRRLMEYKEMYNWSKADY